MSALVKSGLITSLHEGLPFCKVKFFFKISSRLKNFFSFKILFLSLYVLANFIILRAEAAMLCVLVKSSGTCKSGSWNNKACHLEQVNI